MILIFLDFIINVNENINLYKCKKYCIPHLFYKSNFIEEDANKNIFDYLTDRKNSQYKIVMFLEYVPYDAKKYLIQNPNFIGDFYAQSKKIIKFFRLSKVDDIKIYCWEKPQSSHIRFFCEY